MKIGLMGGTFNPVHLAHLSIAEEAKVTCDLERVIFIPAADPPHKPLAGDISFARRCEMVRLAIAGKPAFELSVIEGQRSGKSYSIDTIAAFRQQCPADSFYFIIGSDSFLEIGQWYRYADLVRACSLIVVERPGCRVSDLLHALPAAVQQEFRYSLHAHSVQHEAGTSITYMKGHPLSISSTDIRALAAAGCTLSGLVPREVEEYIKEQGIYAECLKNS